MKRHQHKSQVLKHAEMFQSHPVREYKTYSTSNPIIIWEITTVAGFSHKIEVLMSHTLCYWWKADHLQVLLPVPKRDATCSWCNLLHDTAGDVSSSWPLSINAFEERIHPAPDLPFLWTVNKTSCARTAFQMCQINFWHTSMRDTKPLLMFSFTSFSLFIF